MIFTTSRTNFLTYLSLISPVLPTHSNKPITECVKLQLVENDLKITATDLSTTFVSVVEVNGSIDGGAVVDGKKLLSIIRGLPDGKIQIKKDENILKIISGTIKFELTITEDLEEFPKTPDALSQNQISIESLKLKKYIETTTFATSTDELRAVFTGVLFNLNSNELTLVATDSVRMVKILDQTIKYEGENRELIIPQKSLQVVNNSILKNEECTILFEENFVEFRFSTVTIFTRLISGKFPSYNAIIPVNNELKIVFDKTSLINALNRISIACNPSTKLIKAHLLENKLILTSEDSITSSNAKEELEIVYSGEEMIIGINYSKIISLLKHIKTARVEMKISTAFKPLLIEPYEDDESFEVVMVLMPVKLVDNNF